MIQLDSISFIGISTRNFKPFRWVTVNVQIKLESNTKYELLKFDEIVHQHSGVSGSGDDRP